MTHAALQREGLAGHELEVRHGQLDAHAANLQFGVAVVAHGRHFDVGLEGLRVSLLELLQLGGPGQRADNVDVDVIRAPLGGGHAGQAADALLGGSVGALAVVAEQAGTGGKVDDRTLCLFQIGIARLHVVEGGIQTRVDRQIKLFCGVVCQRHAGGGCLCVVDQHVDRRKRPLLP